MPRLRLAPLAAALFVAQTAQADLMVSFIEGAPKDRFVIQATGDCPLGPMTVAINLATSPAGLIFDTTGAGAGVEVFQPFELVSGGDIVTTQPRVKDGDQSVTLALKALPTQTKVAFTVDVDDTGGGREITVSNAEIAGATVTMKTERGSQTARFDTSSKARIKSTSCSS